LVAKQTKIPDPTPCITMICLQFHMRNNRWKRIFPQSP
jgi:hypothetical protein